VLITTNKDREVKTVRKSLYDISTDVEIDPNRKWCLMPERCDDPTCFVGREFRDNEVLQEVLQDIMRDITPAAEQFIYSMPPLAMIAVDSDRWVSIFAAIDS
jgi:hypothetical protein